MTILILYSVAVCVLVWVFGRVAYREKELDATADDQMWAREIAKFTQRVRSRQ